MNRTIICATLVMLATAGGSLAQSTAEALLPRAVLQALDQELSGNAAKDHVSRLAQFHRVPASNGFHDAIDYIAGRAKAFGLSDVHVETFPGDGKTYFGTLLGNRGWRVEGGDLSEVSPRPRGITSYEDTRVAVADNSESADVTADLVDAGAGTTAADYEGRDVKGKLVLADGNPGAVHREAVESRGAVGIISYNANQQTGWWRDDQDLVRWGHLDARGRANTFAIMISLREARALQQRLGSGERISLHAVVKARNDDASPYETLMATIPGTDPAAGEIVFSCHLDHQKPGANDNASGCAANLEIARTLSTLVTARRIPPPKRTIRFVWPSEMTGTIAYLTKSPELAARIRAAVHLDMVGGDPFVTKSVLHITRSPWSIPTITDDVAETFGRYVIDGAYEGAASGDASRAFRAPGASKDAFWADITPYESGSDHQIYQEGSFGIPAVYLRDWPDIYIHTNKDLPDNIEPTKIKRSAFIAAASGYYLASLPDGSIDALIATVVAGAHARVADDARRAIARMGAGQRPSRDVINLVAQAIDREQRRVRSITRFMDDRTAASAAFKGRLDEAEANVGAIWKSIGLTSEPIVPSAERRRGRGEGEDARVPSRVRTIKGPLGPSDPWVQDKAGGAARTLAIARLPYPDLTFEVVNFIDARRTVSEIRDAVSAEFGPVPLAAVAEYLDLLARIGAVTFAK
jgi:aminopeptidase YwaD